MEHDMKELAKLLERYATEIERELNAQDHPRYCLTDVRNAVDYLLIEARRDAREF